MTGVNITAMTGGSDDYISGYLIVPRILGTVFSGMAEITVLILAAVLFIVLLIFLAVLIISCILIKKRKLKADAWMKIIVFSIFTCVAAFLIQSSVIAVMMAVPVVFGAYVLAKQLNNDSRELCAEKHGVPFYFAGKTIWDDSLPNRKKCIKSNTVICIKSRTRFLCRQVIRYFLIL